MSKNLKLYGKEYYDYSELLSSGTVYFIFISKRLLFKPMTPIWAYILVLFLVRNNIFLVIIGLPSLVVVTTFLVKSFSLWEACNVSKKAYIVFHSVFIAFLKVISIPISMFLEVLWTLCF